MDLKKLVLGQTMVIGEDIWEGSPDQYVTNPNPKSHNKYILRKSAQQWLLSQGHKRPEKKQAPQQEASH